MENQVSSPKGAQPPNFRSIFVVAKWLDGSRCHLSIVAMSIVAAWIQDAIWYGGRHPPYHTVLDGDPASLSKRGRSPQFSANVYFGQSAAWIKMLLGMEVGLGPGHIVLDGDPAPHPPKKGHSPQFATHVCCGQTAGWIKMPLGTMVGLGPGNIVLDANSAPPQGGTTP